MMTRSSPSDIPVRSSSSLVVESSQSSVGADGSSREREDEDPEVIILTTLQKQKIIYEEIKCPLELNVEHYF